jgi:hypothetical protein
VLARSPLLLPEANGELHGELVGFRARREQRGTGKGRRGKLHERRSELLSRTITELCAMCEGYRHGLLLQCRGDLSVAVPKATHNGTGATVEIATSCLVNEPHALSVRHDGQVRTWGSEQRRITHGSRSFRRVRTLRLR